MFTQTQQQRPTDPITEISHSITQTMCAVPCAHCIQQRPTSLLSAGPRARSYRLFGVMFPTASRNVALVIVFTLNFLYEKRQASLPKYSDHSRGLTIPSSSWWALLAQQKTDLRHVSQDQHNSSE